MSSQNCIYLDFSHLNWPSEPGPGRDVYWRIITESNAKYLIWDISHVNPSDYDRLGKRIDRGGGDTILGFEIIPPGDWNVARLNRPDDGSDLVIASTEKAVLVNEDTSFDSPALRTFDVAALELETMYRRPPESEQRRDPQLYGGGRYNLLTSAVSLEHFNVEGAIVHMVPYLGFSEWRYNESKTFHVVADKDITPRILANLTEHGTRPVGWVIEHVAGRFATARDIPECRAVLTKLHGLGISYGDLYRHSFLIIQDGPDGKTRALMQDFRWAEPSTDESQLAEEMEMVESFLAGIESSIAPSL